MKKLYPIGIQSFEKLRKENYLYIDKTSFVYELVPTTFLTVPGVLGKAFFYPLSKLTSKAKRSYFKVLLLKKWRKTGFNTPFCIST